MDMDDETPPKEDSIQAFIGEILEPMLNKVPRFEQPSPENHEEVAKQMRAVVLLYNFYLRKEFPQLEFLDAFAFCKNAVVMCAKLISYMGVLKGTGTNQLTAEFVQRATITEKMVKEACDTCEALASSRTISEINTWPVSKVAVFVVDAAYQRCILIFGSVTRGVWSLVEKDVDDFDSLHGLMPENAKQNKDRVSRKKLHGDVPSGTATKDFKKLLSLAFSAVTEQTGLNKVDLQVAFYSLVYSLTKPKTSCQLFMMRCMNSGPLKSPDCKWVPVEDALGNVRGPLLENVRCSYVTGSSVPYFHLRPYFDAIHDWLSRKDSIDIEGIPEAFENVQDSEDQKVASNNQHNLAQSCSANSCKRETREPNVSCMKDESLNTNAYFLQDPLDTGMTVKNGNQQLGPAVDTVYAGNAARRLSDWNLQSMQHASASAEQVSLPLRTVMHNRIKTGLGQETVNVRITKDATLNGMRVGGEETHSLLPFSGVDGVRPQNSKVHDMHALNSQQNVVNYSMGDHEKLPNGIQENNTRIDSDNKKAAIKVIVQKREKLIEDLIMGQSQQQSQSKELLGQIAKCDANMETILRGGTDAVILVTEIQNKISAYGNCNTAVEPSSLASRDLKRRKLSEGILFLRSSSQELTDICMKNRWSMPSYFISIPSNPYDRDYFHAKVKIRGYDFELEETGFLKNGEIEAKESAASLMLSRLYQMGAASTV